MMYYHSLPYFEQSVIVLVLQVIEVGGPGGVNPPDYLRLRLARVNCQETGPRVESDPGAPPGSVR